MVRTDPASTVVDFVAANPPTRPATACIRTLDRPRLVHDRWVIPGAGASTPIVPGARRPRRPTSPKRPTKTWPCRAVAPRWWCRATAPRTFGPSSSRACSACRRRVRSRWRPSAPRSFGSYDNSEWNPWRSEVAFDANTGPASIFSASRISIRLPLPIDRITRRRRPALDGASASVVSWAVVIVTSSKSPPVGRRIRPRRHLDAIGMTRARPFPRAPR